MFLVLGKHGSPLWLDPLVLDPRDNSMDLWVDHLYELQSGGEGQ
jgi:hypothetical protein